MKTIITILLLVFTITGLFAGGNADDKNKLKYRITAIKNGDRSVISESNISDVTVPRSVYIPDAFTPNGDGLNDRFGVSADGIEYFTMTVYNKWGKLIFESTNINEQWDGTYGGELVQDGAYAYLVGITSAGERNFVKSGTVLVIK